jgi:hypothetical protein
MRASEFIRENASTGASVAGGMAPIAQPLGAVITRELSVKPAKYRNSAPVQKRKQHASG